MIQNYAEYEMTEKKRVLFLGVGYLAAAGIVFLFYHSFILDVLTYKTFRNLLSGLFIELDNI